MLPVLPIDVWNLIYERVHHSLYRNVMWELRRRTRDIHDFLEEYQMITKYYAKNNSECMTELSDSCKESNEIEYMLWCCIRHYRHMEIVGSCWAVEYHSDSVTFNTPLDISNFSIPE